MLFFQRNSVLKFVVNCGKSKIENKSKLNLEVIFNIIQQKQIITRKKEDGIRPIHLFFHLYILKLDRGYMKIATRS